VDDAHHVITAATASTAGSKDSMILPEIVDQAIDNLKWIFHSIVYHLFQMIVYQEFSPKFTTLSAV
jgi:hypothetical protein